MLRGVLFRAAIAALALLPLGALARADDGDTSTPRPTPLTQLRPSEIRVAPIPTLDPGTVRPLEPRAIPARPVPEKELVLFVGGYGSRADDGAFDALKTRFPADRYEVRQFGQDPRFPFDTYGSLDVSAGVLIREVREVGPQYAAVNIVSHSMGGVIVDRAFAGGLSAGDGVATHVSIAGPHSGADYARVPTVVLPLIAPVKEIVRTAAVLAARDPESPAARDLATARPMSPPRGVARLDVSLATDGIVNRYDARNVGVPQRIFLPASPAEALDGHGGSLVNRQIADLVAETVRTHHVPPDRRDMLTLVVAPLLWDRTTWLWRTILFFTALAAISLYAARFLPLCRRAADRVNALCGRFLRSLGR